MKPEILLKAYVQYQSEDAFRELVGSTLDEATVAGAASHAADGLELVADIHGSQAYRADMTRVMMRRAIQKAAERAR